MAIELDSIYAQFEYEDQRTKFSHRRKMRLKWLVQYEMMAFWYNYTLQCSNCATVIHAISQYIQRNTLLMNSIAPCHRTL